MPKVANDVSAMSLRLRPPQRSFADPEIALLRFPLREDGFEVRFRAVCDDLIPDPIFAELYSERGRPAISPSALTRLLLLQLRNGRSDRQIMEDLKYDLRLQYMCDLPLEACGFDPTVLVYHRMRLLWGTIDREKIAMLKQQEGDPVRRSPAQRCFEHLVDAAVALGILEREQAQGIDSFAILGAAAIQDCFRLIFQGIRQTLRAHAQAAPAAQAELLSRLRRGEYLEKERSKPVIEWTNPEARLALLLDYVQDAATLKVACAELESPEVQQALSQLLRLIDQDLLIDAEGQVTIKKEVASGRQCSVVDPEMRHGRKSRSKRFNGSKGNITVEPQSGIITGAVVTPASTHDGQATPALQEQAQTGILIGDNAFAGLEVRQEALANGTAVVTPTPPLQPFEKDSFTLNEEENTVTCPNGETTTIRKDGTAHFSVKACRNCPFREQCKPAKGGREVTMRPGEGTARNLRAYARTESGAKLIRDTRAATERWIGHLVRCGVRQGRYYGLAKTGLQLLLGVISHNLDRIGRLRQRGRVESPSGKPGTPAQGILSLVWTALWRLEALIAPTWRLVAPWATSLARGRTGSHALPPPPKSALCSAAC